ncbi:Putative trpEGD operon leader peptide [Deinococcus deserti]|uniref:Putative trpEGD operon leader peptide n=1 Tax=Deinococcus deserti (strain DSM 17065 / CIP 109153 / LMG 22923 / VCD115) TaxID=546414 RepID=X5HN13_DEIDV|nr:putative trpEGD operon leader peptide [Deinococcus deserti VCD115]
MTVYGAWWWPSFAWE